MQVGSAGTHGMAPETVLPTILTGVSPYPAAVPATASNAFKSKL